MWYLRAAEFEPVADGEPLVLARRIEAGLYAEHLLASGGHPLAAADELRAVAADGRAAERRCVVAHLRFVGRLAREMAQRTGQCQHELFQEGCLGLIEAVKRFDHARGVSFAGFAAYWIRAYQGRAGDRWAPGGVTRAREQRRVRRLVAELWQQFGRPVTEADLAGAGEARGLEVLTELQVVSLSGGDEIDLPDPRVGSASPMVDHMMIGVMLADLTELERQVIELRYGLGERPMLSGSGTAAELGLSVTAVRRVEHRALGRMRAAGHELLVA